MSSTARRGEHVHVAVAVHVRGEHDSGPIGRRGDRVRREVLAAVVLVPGDRVVVVTTRRARPCRRRRPRPPQTRDIGPIGGRGDRVRREALAAVVLVPGDRVVVSRTRRARPCRRRRPRPPQTRDVAPSAVVVIVCAVKLWLPSFSYQAILSSQYGRGEHVHVAVAVHVRREHDSGPVGGRGDRVRREALRCRRSRTRRSCRRTDDAERTSMSPSPSTSAANTRMRPVGGRGDRVRP